MGQDSTKDLGQRRLAAIVFTDVVGFSARMQDNETETLRLVERDSQFIKDVCTSFRGRILKSTGDGLLMFFDSAVDAVAAALKIQEDLGQLKATATPSEVLEHRIGIHLGDVFIRDDDVMGDGVNVAARLQKEAEPGGICISQTVYEVVKNKLSLQVTSLGPRELKNIREAIPAYQILLAAQKALNAPAKQRSAAGAKPVRVAIACMAVVVALLIAAGVWYFRSKGPVEPIQTQPAVAAAAKPEQPASVAPSVVSPEPQTQPTTTIAPTVAPPAPPTQPSAVVPEPAQTLANAPPVQPSVPPGSGSQPPPAGSPRSIGAPAPPAHALQMSTRWIQGEMFRYSKANRLRIIPPPRLANVATNMPPTTSWMEGSTLHFDVGGKDTPSDLSRTAPIVLEYVLYSLTQAAGPNSVPEPIRRIFEGGPPPQGAPDMGDQGGPPPMPPEGQGFGPPQGGSGPSGDRRPPQR